MGANTIGQATDIAVARHRAAYPESEVYSVNASRAWDPRETAWIVELRAVHFSQPLTHWVYDNAKE